MADDPQRAKDSPPSQPKRSQSWIVAVALFCVAGSIFYGFREYGIRSQQQVDAMNAQAVLMKAQELQKIYDDKMAIYKPVTEAAAKIAALKAQGANPAQMQDAVTQFKTLAWGPAAVGGGANFNSAVQLFSRGLDAGADADQLKQLSLDLARVCGIEAQDASSKMVEVEGLAGYAKNSDGSEWLIQEMNEIVRVPESRQAAEQWLSLVDGGLYAESWKSASDYFQATIPQERWVRAIGSIRAPFGSVLSRKMVRADYSRTMPGAPDEDYMVVQFATSFSGRNDAVEKVTTVFDKEGRWRVSAYAIK
jgi:hypothetical protein